MTSKNCPHCLTRLEDQDRRFIQHGVSLGRFPARVCPVCERVYFPEASSRAIEAAARRAGVWALARSMRRIKGTTLKGGPIRKESRPGTSTGTIIVTDTTVTVRGSSRRIRPQQAQTESTLNVFQ